MSSLSSYRSYHLLLACLVSLLAGKLDAFQITGAQGGINAATGERPLRYEINDFASSGAPFDVFILALSAFQAVPQSDPLSYFQISGLFPLSINWEKRSRFHEGSMAFLRSHGTALLALDHILDSVRTRLRHFRPGTAATWHCSR